MVQNLVQVVNNIFQTIETASTFRGEFLYEEKLVRRRTETKLQGNILTVPMEPDVSMRKMALQ